MALTLTAVEQEKLRRATLKGGSSAKSAAKLLLELQENQTADVALTSRVTAEEADTAADNASAIAGQPIYADVSITNAEFLAIRATPKTIIAAPGVGKKIHVISPPELYFDYTAAYTETIDNLSFKYTDGVGATIATVETTGFVDATVDTMTFASMSAASNLAKTAVDNQAVVLHNTGDGEFGGGNAANVVRVRILYRIIPAGW